MKKKTKALWHGINNVFTAVVNWLAILFGMKDGSKYGLILRKIIGTAFAVMVVLWTTRALVRFSHNIGYFFESFFGFSDNNYYLSETLSDCVNYYEGYDGESGYLRNEKGKKILKNIEWIAKPMEGDSLVCYSDGNLRGYFHMHDGRIIVKPNYHHAWIFSNGLAAIEDDGEVKFINQSGQTVIDKSFAFNPSNSGYVFHEGYCAVHDNTGNSMGLIDSKGNWVIEPKYKRIEAQENFWMVSLDDSLIVLSFKLDTIIPFTQAKLIIYDDYIEATYPDHTVSTFNFDGKLISSMQIHSIYQLMYNTQDVVYRDNGSDEDYYNAGTYVRQAVASCLCYEAEQEWYGLLSPDGKIITPPSYIRIQAIGKDLYLCETSYGNGIILNSKGVRVQ